jgi:uncharacterized membrane protein
MAWRTLRWNAAIFLIVFAFVAQTAAFARATPVVANADSSSDTVLCHAASADAAGQTDAPKKAGHHGRCSHCVRCSPNSHLFFVAPSAVAQSAYQAVSRVAAGVRAPAELCPGLARGSAHLPRAPPSLS